jgi:hypothetical protein
VASSLRKQARLLRVDTVEKVENNAGAEISLKLARRECLRWGQSLDFAMLALRPLSTIPDIITPDWDRSAWLLPAPELLPTHCGDSALNSTT